MKQLFLNPQRFTVCSHVDVLESDDGALSGRVTRSQVERCFHNLISLHLHAQRGLFLLRAVNILLSHANTASVGCGFRSRSQVDKLGFIPSSQRVSVPPCLQPDPKVQQTGPLLTEEDELRLSKC